MHALIPLFVILPLAAAFLIPVIGRFGNGFQKTASTTVSLFLSALSLYFMFLPDPVSYSYMIGGW